MLWVVAQNEPVYRASRLAIVSRRHDRLVSYFQDDLFPAIRLLNMKMFMRTAQNCYGRMPKSLVLTRIGRDDVLKTEGGGGP